MLGRWIALMLGCGGVQALPHDVESPAASGADAATVLPDSVKFGAEGGPAPSRSALDADLRGRGRSLAAPDAASPSGERALPTHAASGPSGANGGDVPLPQRLPPEAGSPPSTRVAPEAGSPPLSSSVAGSSVAKTTAATRVIAIGDLHADLAATRAVFAGAGLADAAGRWTGGSTVAVQTGDITDRGPDGRATLAWLRSVQADAAARGGRLVTLIGNHEAMNLTGDWRYVSAQDLAGYGGEAARRRAFGPEGEDGAWLRRQDAVAQVNDTVFVHGGIDAHWAALGVAGLNAGVREALAAVTQGTLPPTSLPAILGPDGPLWNRGLVLSEEPAACPELARALAALGARRMVVGHTTQRDGRIGERCGGTLYAIDTGISALYGSHRAALEIAGGQARPLPFPAPVP